MFLPGWQGLLKSDEIVNPMMPCHVVATRFPRDWVGWIVIADAECGQSPLAFTDLRLSQNIIHQQAIIHNQRFLVCMQAVPQLLRRTKTACPSPVYLAAWDNIVASNERFTRPSAPLTITDMASEAKACSRETEKGPFVVLQMHSRPNRGRPSCQMQSKHAECRLERH